MYRILVVDDERHIVNWLCSLFEAQDMELEVLKAYTGSDALKILTENRIDIIILDIKMPGLNGIQVAERIIEYWPLCRIIFLTGFNNFDYIYKANKMNHVTYLLKTEEDEVIVASVANAIASLEVEKNTIRQNQIDQQKDFLLNYLLQKEFLKDILSGKQVWQLKSKMSLYQPVLPLDTTMPLYLALCHVKWIDTLPDVDTLHNDHILELNQLMQMVLTDKYHFASIDLDDNNFLFLIQAFDTIKLNDRQSPVIFLKESLSAMHTQMTHQLTTILYYRAVEWSNVVTTHESLAGLLHELYSATDNFSIVYLLLTEDKLSHIKLGDMTAKNTIRINQLKKALQQQLYQGDFDKCRFTLKELRQIYTHRNSMHSLPFIELYFSLSTIYMKYIVDYNLNEKIAAHIALYPLYFINEFENWEKAFDFLQSLTKVLEELKACLEQDTAQKLIESIKAYIQQHLGSQLTLTEISEVVNYNSSYVSRFFKKQTGVSLFDFITAERINQAKFMLKDTDEPIASIAATLGFDTSQYFSIVFKKSIGVSPRDYRVQHFIS